MRQTKCHWPSGREIRRMSTQACLDTLASFGVEGDQLQAMQKSGLRDLISTLKRRSHESGDCECPAAAYIRAGGGQLPSPP